MDLFFEPPSDIPPSYQEWKKNLRHELYEQHRHKKSSGGGAPRKARWSEIKFLAPFQRKHSEDHLTYGGAGARDWKKTLSTTIFFLGWLCFFVFLARLYFMNDGIADLVEIKQVIASEKKALKLNEKEIVYLREDIQKIRTKKSYQKKMARKHLGVIAKDEYLVLFEEGRN